MAPDTTYTKRVDVLRPEDFALPSAELTETLRAVTKELFDYGAPPNQRCGREAHPPAHAPCCALPTLGVRARSQAA